MKIVITAGPTREHIDPVRFISNRSTGKMGFAIAASAIAHGHQVTLIAGPVSLATPEGALRIDVISALDMLDAVRCELPSADVLIMSAAVADWRPKEASTTKLKKSTMAPTIELLPNPDILLTLKPSKENRLFVGFAAETGDPLAEAKRKLTAKGLDMMVANDVSRPDAGFAVDTNLVTLLYPNAPAEHLPLLDKRQVADEIITRIEKLHNELNIMISSSSSRNPCNASNLTARLS
ncbi:MAG: phosphopantothenoylcysteine decarboxylase [Lentisphaerae bacterium]|jgi:phosphopantothenoylcysteine decarboxylase/phosphopantothenate--cysteine ligase|nr:phosphopantothenoylcysteine decarboxylase [Lentisphaerota bacterium]